jgi:hypothetical protein
MKFGLYILEHLLYRTHWSELQCDATISVFLIKTIVISYVAYTFSNEHLFYRTHWLNLKTDAIESVYSIKIATIRYLAFHLVSWWTDVSWYGSIKDGRNLELELQNAKDRALTLMTEHYKTPL